ncbi:hypothetical protein BST95_00330 [Halioglobus japonicus]|uniref:Methyltransferase FkbM domain-containing protein n=1 Tax=Halioglobus japonicus TaxID=930805 RepID=A0AAP8SLW5_9GAMM|nr:hypothetical protein BST95_00330 [Halioglobus japonicus]PLW84781.1 hypothetical protein C0029_17425 [Halioglobus japonicus]GHD21391.1 hypothetical protein GCM10007052_32110 [Halioglobus japonicus]
MVSVTTIDKFCSTHGLKPNHVKIDVEGVEGKVLLGAREVLEQGNCKYICEWLGGAEKNREAANLLERCGYVALDPSCSDRVDLGSIEDHEDRNVLLVHSSKAPSLEILPKGTL